MVVVQPVGVALMQYPVDYLPRPAAVRVRSPVVAQPLPLAHAPRFFHRIREDSETIVVQAAIVTAQLIGGGRQREDGRGEPGAFSRFFILVAHFYQRSARADLDGNWLSRWGEYLRQPNRTEGAADEVAQEIGAH